MSNLFESKGVVMHEYRMYGPFRAFVKDNRDPKKQNRIKVTCPSALGFDEKGRPVESNWAYPMNVLGGGRDIGVSCVPPIKDRDGNPVMVWIFFEMGDVSKPVWIGGPYGVTSKQSDVPTVARKHEDGSDRPEPNNFVFQTPGGIIVELDDSSKHNKARVTLSNGDFIEVRNAPNQRYVRVKSPKLLLDSKNVEIYGDLKVFGNAGAYKFDNI